MIMPSRSQSASSSLHSQGGSVVEYFTIVFFTDFHNPWGGYLGHHIAGRPRGHHFFLDQEAVAASKVVMWRALGMSSLLGCLYSTAQTRVASAHAYGSWATRET